MHFSRRIFDTHRKKLPKRFSITKRTLKSASFRENIKKFSLSTSLHGFKYIGGQGSIAEKMFWSTVLICVSVLCAVQIVELIKYWNKGKIIQTQETTEMRVWDIPFPAFTFCSDYQFDNTRASLDDAKAELDDDVYKDTINFGDTLCSKETEVKSMNKSHSNEAIHYTFTEMSYACRTLFYQISYMNEVLPNHCSYMQVNILSQGKCYSFNMIPHDQMISPDYAKILKSYSSDKYFKNYANDTIPNWEPRSGFRENDPVSPPWRILGSMTLNSLKFILNLNVEHFINRCRLFGNGVTVGVHSPVNHPSFSTDFYITSNTYTRAALTPKMVTASEELQTWTPKTRGCFFEGEKRLQFFKVYTQNNCELECKANKTLHICGCVAHHHPRNGSTPVCSLSERKCVHRASSTGYSIFGNKSVTIQNVSDHLGLCSKCLPPCIDITYAVEINKLSRNVTYKADFNSQNGTIPKNMAVLEVFFKHGSVDSLRRSPMIRSNELIANIGGVMSLCLGCSIVSLFEIIYFIVLRKYFTRSTKISYGKSTTLDGRPVISIFLK